MSLEDKISLLEELMELEEGTLTADSALNDYKEWDSLSKLSLMAVAKKQFNKKMTAEDLNGFHTVQEICDYLG